MPPVNSSPNFVNRQVPTVTQWDAYFSAKVDAQGGQFDSGSITGTISGSPTWSALQTFSGGAAITGGTLSGSFAGTPTWTGQHTFTAGMVLSNLPTAVTGLPAGTLWNNGGVLCVA